MRVVTRSRIHAYWRAEKPAGGYRREPISPDANDEVDLLDSQRDPATEALDEVWQREWEDNLMSTAFRRLRSRVSSQQLLIFHLSTVGGLPLTQVAVLYAPEGRSFWRVTNFRETALYDRNSLEPILPLALSADGRRLAVSLDDQRVQVWDLVDLRARFRELGLDW